MKNFRQQRTQRVRLQVTALEDRVVPSVAGDFNNDGWGDLAIGVPNADVAGDVNAGAVRILYGKSAGLALADTQYLTQDSFGFYDNAEANDRFGAALAVGNFNGDAWADLAVGSPGESFPNGIVSAGFVHVLYGSNAGLRTDNVGRFSQTYSLTDGGPDAESSVGDRAENYDQFGTTLAAGDYNGDGNDELFVGVPYEDVVRFSFDGPVPDVVDAGIVHAIFVAAAPGIPNREYRQGDAVAVDLGPDLAEPGDQYGFSLAIGNVYSGGYDELIIGAPFEDVGNQVDAGTLHIKSFGASGVGSLRTQDSWAIPTASETGDQFAYSLATGDFNGDLCDDLAIGVPGELIGGADNAGAVHVLLAQIYSNGSHYLTDATDQFWHQNNLVGAAEAGDRFGHSLAAGDFDGDGDDDLAVGVPYESLLSGLSIYQGAGAVHVIYGTRYGLNSANNQFWKQGSASAGDAIEANDHFGLVLAAGHFNGDSHADLVIGVPFEDLGSTNNGLIHVLYGADALLGAALRQMWSQYDFGGLVGSSDLFGFSLGADR